MIGLALLATAAALVPAHPARVAEAVAPAADKMLQNVYHGDIRISRVDCNAPTRNGRQTRAIRCTIALRSPNPDIVLPATLEATSGTQTPGRCTKPAFYEDFSGHVTVATHQRGTWCAHLKADNQ